MRSKTSDIVKVSEQESGGKTIIEIEFRFIRYQLVIDDHVKALDLAEKIRSAAQPVFKQEGEPVKLPKFYKDYARDAP